MWAGVGQSRVSQTMSLSHGPSRPFYYPCWNNSQNIPSSMRRIKRAQTHGEKPNGKIKVERFLPLELGFYVTLLFSRVHRSPEQMHGQPTTIRFMNNPMIFQPPTDKWLGLAQTLSQVHYIPLLSSLYDK